MRRIKMALDYIVKREKFLQKTLESLPNAYRDLYLRCEPLFKPRYKGDNMENQIQDEYAPQLLLW